MQASSALHRRSEKEEEEHFKPKAGAKYFCEVKRMKILPALEARKKRDF